MLEIGYYEFLGNTCYFDGEIVTDLDSLEEYDEMMFSMMHDGYLGKDI